MEKELKDALEEVNSLCESTFEIQVQNKDRSVYSYKLAVNGYYKIHGNFDEVFWYLAGIIDTKKYKIK